MSLYPLLSAPSSVVAFSSLPPSGISPLAVSGDGSKILPQFFPHTFFKGLQVEEPSIRSQALQLILSKLEALVVDAESLISNTESATIDKQGIQSLQNWSNGLNSLSQLQTRKIARETVFMLLPSALRLTYECPFLDVQSALTSFISKTEARLGLRVPSPLPVSAFISPSSLIQRNTSDDIRRNLILRSFIAYGRVSNVTNVLAFHPAYLDCFLNTYSVLLHDEGALPLPWRAFISILACARHSCTYYVRRQQDAFIVYGGNPTWLTGLNSQGVPQKIRALTELNALLAHRPWMINAKHIRALTQPSPLPSSNGNNNISSSLDPWSINELIHAIVILTNFHCSCSIILGCGLCREPDVGILVGRHVCRPIDLGGENPRSNTTTLSNDSTPTPLSPLALNLSHIGIISSDKQPTFSSSSSSSSSSAIISTSNMSLSSLRIHSNGVIPSSSSSGGANLSSRGGVSNSEKRIEQDARREADLRARLLRGATNDGDDYLQFSEIGIDENDLLEEARSVSTAGGGGGVTGGRSTKSFGARSITHSPRSSRRTHPQSSPQIKSYGGSIPADTLPNTPLVLNDGIGGIGIDDDAKSRGGWELTRSSSYALDGNEDDVDDDDDDDNDDDFDDETELGWGDKSFVDEDDEEFTKGSGLGNTRVGVSESQFGGTEEEREALSDMINFQRAGLGAEPYTSLSIGIDTDPSDNAPAADTLFGLVSDSADMSTLLDSSHQFGDTVEPVQTVDTVHQTELSISMPILAPISGRSDAVSEDGRTTMITSITARGPGTTDDLGTEITSSSTQGGRGGLGGLGGISSTPTVRTSIAAQDRKKYCGQGIIRFTSEPHSVLAVQRAYALRLASANAALATTTTTTTSTISTGTVPYLNISSTTISSDNNNTNNKITSSSASLSAASSASSSPPPKLNKLSRSERHKARKVRLPPTELRIESLRYRDFDTSEPMLITHDFSWEEHGFDLVARFFPAAAPVLDKQFKIAFDLTYNVFSGTGEYVNTEPFRTAIKMYVLRLFGVRNDHYDYAMVNKFMTIATKTFVKKVVCAPETVTADDFANFSFLFSDDEKVHIILLASEARRQSALLWGLNAVTSVFRGGVV